MDKTFNTKKTKLLRQMQCAICLGGVKEALLCPHCSRFYCKKCIHCWMCTKSQTCPNCRASVRYDALVKGCSINEMQESIKQLVGCMDSNRCDQHKEHYLTLFCFSCEVNICAKCWFSPDHADHKERVVPTDEAYEYYRKDLKTGMVWVNGRKKLILEGLGQVTKNLQQLKLDCEQIQQLCDKSAELVAGEASSAALTNIVHIVGTVKELRSKRQRDTEAIRIDRRGDFMLEPTVLVFCFPGFYKNMDEEVYISTTTDPNGFVWKCVIGEYETDLEDDNENSEDENDEADEEKDNVNGEEEEQEEDDDDHYSCSLSLLEGKPSEYSITFYNEPEKVLRFDLNKALMIGWLKPDVDNNDNCRVTVEIRQTYTDKIQLLKDRIEQLEKQCANQKSFRTFLSDYEKSMGPSSG